MKISRLLFIFLIIIIVIKTIHSQYYLSFDCNQYYYYMVQNTSYYLLYNQYNEPIYVAILNSTEYQNFYNLFENSYLPIEFPAEEYFVLNSIPFYLFNVTEGDYIIYWPEDCNYNNGNLSIIKADNYLPIGISSFQNVETNSVRGNFIIYNLSSGPLSLQLNVILEINTTNGYQYYWLQNVLIINQTYYYLIDNIWNLTNPYMSYLFNNIIYGNGIIAYNNNPNGFQGYYYVYSTQNYNIKYPIEGYLEIKIINTSPLTIGFIYNINGNHNIYDTVTINIPDIINAYIISSPSYNNIYNFYYDSELVFGGPGNGGNVNISNINSILELEYYNLTIGRYSTYTQYIYNFGFNTGETAANINSIILDNESFALINNGNFQPFNFQYNNYIIANITIYYPNGTLYNNLYISNQSIIIDIPKEINSRSIEYYYAGYYYLNGEKYYSNYIQINNSGDFEIYPYYYQLNEINISSYVPINISGFELSPSGYIPIEYYNVYNISLYILNNSSILIYLPNYYYLNNFSRYYCNITNLSIYIESPENINLSDYCIIQYFVNISSKYLININGKIVKDFVGYINEGENINIKGYNIFINGLFYYIPSQNIEVNGPIIILVNPKINYEVSFVVYLSIIIAIVIILIFI